MTQEWPGRFVTFSRNHLRCVPDDPKFSAAWEDFIAKPSAAEAADRARQIGRSTWAKVVERLGHEGFPVPDWLRALAGASTAEEPSILALRMVVDGHQVEVTATHATFLDRRGPTQVSLSGLGELLRRMEQVRSLQ